eukprot:GSMAST32.ASY1.ANO1.2721.1 assembled CDS
MFLISPWSRGDYVFSEVADHTSVIQFIEKRFNVHCPNISPWRRAVTSDLIAAFDFTHPDFSWPKLPSTKGNVEASKEQCSNDPPPTIPSIQSIPKQEPGTKLLRPIPSYVFDIKESVDYNGEKISLTISHRGEDNATAGHFNVYVLFFFNFFFVRNFYTVEGTKQLTGTWSTENPLGEYSLYLHVH